MSLQVKTIEDTVIELSSTIRDGNTPLVEIPIHGPNRIGASFNADRDDLDALIAWIQWAKTQLPAERVTS